jgi:hypothetical protein
MGRIGNWALYTGFDNFPNRARGRFVDMNNLKIPVPLQ